jgi:hypothetical protein
VPDDPLPSLARIRETAEAEIVHPDDECGPEVGGYCTPHAALVLAGALEAVLKLHQPDDRGAGACCKGCATHVTFTRWPCLTVQAITAKLTGKEAGDGGR